MFRTPRGVNGRLRGDNRQRVPGARVQYVEMEGKDGKRSQSRSVAGRSEKWCGIIPLRPGLGGEAEANAREHAARREARLHPFGRARENGVAHWPVTRSRPVVHLRERPVTGSKPTRARNNRNGRT